MKRAERSVVVAFQPHVYIFDERALIVIVVHHNHNKDRTNHHPSKIRSAQKCLFTLLRSHCMTPMTHF